MKHGFLLMHIVENTLITVKFSLSYPCVYPQISHPCVYPQTPNEFDHKPIKHISGGGRRVVFVLSKTLMSTLELRNLK